jgi:hypothetical protein
MVLAAARRLMGLFAVVGGVTLLLSLLLGAMAGTSLRRSLALGFYVVGCVLLIAGFFVGNRGVLRAETDEERSGGVFGFGRRGVRSATGEEQRESIRVSGLVIGLGIALLILGAIADTENNLA